MTLCLMCKNGEGLKLIDADWEVIKNNLQSKPDSMWEIGDWAMSPNRLTSLIGKQVILTKSKTTPSYIGGRITGFKFIGNRIRILFKEQATLKGFNKHVGVWVGSNPVFYLEDHLLEREVQ